MKVLLRVQVGLILFILGLINASRVRADLIIGDIAGNIRNSGYAVGPGSGLNNAIAQGFVMTQTVSLESVDLYLQNYSSAVGSSLAVSIYSDNAGLPNVSVYDLTTTNIPLPVGGTPTSVNFTGVTPFTLTANTKYWLNFYATNPSSPTGDTITWSGASTSGFANINPTGPYATDVGQLRSVSAGNPPIGSPSTTELRTAFQLNGSIAAVPEPSSLAMIGIAMAGLAVNACRRAKAKVQID